MRVALLFDNFSRYHCARVEAMSRHVHILALQTEEWNI